ncbi:MAG TPA: hypothetical protein PLM14_13960 [Candidatus Hydrogenedentes bacterium]|nr:hypothetical protein [Candidatus Hydrogenedentota bacterium]
MNGIRFTSQQRRVRLAGGMVVATCLSLLVFSSVGARAESGIRGEVVLARASHDWMSQQIEEPCILPNPKVPGRLIMFYSAVSSSNRVVAAVGKAWADERDPFRWHQDDANPVFGPSKGGWDSCTIRLDTVLYVAEEDAYYIYYSGTTGSVQDRIGLAICPAGADGYSEVAGDAIVRHGTAPVLAPEPAAPYFEDMASQAAVMREWNEGAQQWRWYMYYSYRGKDGTLPGIRLATSNDGKSWTRHFNAEDPRGMGQIFESTPKAYYGWHQISVLAGTYVLCIEVGVDHGARWRPVLAVSTDPAKGWTQLDVDTVLQTKWQGLYDDRTLYHVATPALYQIAGKWYLFAQACGRPGNDNYIDGAWEMWCVACDRAIPTRPGCSDVYIPGLPGAAAPAGH